MQHARRGLRPLLADALVGARFWPVWIATGVLVLVAANIASAVLQNTSWAFVLPYMTVLAIAALGQMLVVMQAGIDLSTPGVMFLGGNLIVGVGEGSNDRLAARDPRLPGSRGVRRPRQRDSRRGPPAEPADRDARGGADRLRRGPPLLQRVGGDRRALAAVGLRPEQARRDHQPRLLGRSGDHTRRRSAAPLHGARPALSGGRGKSESRVDGRACASEPTSSSPTRPRPRSTRSRQCCSRAFESASTRASAPPICSRRSPPSSSPARRSRAGWRARPRPGWRRSP